MNAGERNVTHHTFVIERSYAASPSRVFNAFADPVIKSRWFGNAEDWDVQEQSYDFRVGGEEHNLSRFRGNAEHPDGFVSEYDAQYRDIVPDNRIVFTYHMHFNGDLISVSLATVQLAPEGAGTKLTYTEQGAFLDAFDKPEGREQGTRELFDALGAELQRQSAEG